MYNGANNRSRTTAICYDFVKGVCQRGNDCRYSHDLSLIARTARGNNSGGRASEVCYDFLRCAWHFVVVIIGVNFTRNQSVVI